MWSDHHTNWNFSRSVALYLWTRNCPVHKPFFLAPVLCYQEGQLRLGEPKGAKPDHRVGRDMGGSLGGRKESSKTERKKLLPVELEERAARRAPISPSASSKMHSVGKREGSVSRDVSLELESTPFIESTWANISHCSRCPPGPGGLSSTWETSGGQ